MGAPAQPTDVTLIGLSAEQAAQRLATDGPNELPTAKRRNILQEAWDVIRQPMLLLLLGAGAVNFLLAEPLDGAMLMAFVVVVIGISIYQEHKTERALAALRDLSSPRALVVRDGAQIRIAGRDVVRGDVMLLAEGDRVPADAVVVDCAFSVDESALTGESVPVRKVAMAEGEVSAPMGRPGGDATAWLFSGTLAVKGHAIAVAKETGAGTELGKIGAALRTIEPERTALQREIDRLVKVLAVIGVLAAAIVVVVYGLTRGNWLGGLLAGIATAMALLPEEFPVVLTVFLALGAWRISKKHVLTRRPPVIETLGSATVLCVDKTGTLTLNRMTVRQLIIDGQAYTVDEQPLPEQFHTLAEFGVLASPIDPFDPMDKAFKELGEKYLSGTPHLHDDWELVREYPLSEKLLALSHVWRSPDGGRYVIAAKGAPEAIADLCHFSSEKLEQLTAQVEQATANGQRVLAAAFAYFGTAAELPAKQHDFDFEYLGLVGLHDPVRPGVADAVAECRRASVRTIMITGDYPGTALAIAKEIGLDHASGCITGRELESMSGDELAERIRDVSVFARMVPEQKLQLVRALKANGDVVGMTGDGVNDAPALRAADIGIAMGAHGVRLVAMADIERRLPAVAAAQRYGLTDIIDVDRLLELPDVDVVYISTPPFLHYKQSKSALAAGKHVICEKPLALTVEQADELVGLARRKDLLIVADLMQRYNPLFDIVGRVINRAPLGEFLHGYFENYASDENLPPGHWFWDREQSGGIFVEHGVHFFDMLAGWLGAGDVVAAQASRRSDGCEDQVQCTVRYAGGAHVNFYHGFHQPGRMDRQELRLVFECGDMLLQDWVPTRVRIHAVADESQTRELSELFPGARIDVLTTYGAGDRGFYSHGHWHDVYQQFELHWEGLQKMPLYCELLRRMMTDQAAWIGDRGHQRKINEHNGRDSVAMACAADVLAHRPRA